MAKDRKKAPKKTLRGKIPSKQTINLVLVDENKINPLRAIPGILLIVILAALFGKFMVADRLAAMSASEARASRIRSDLNAAYAAIEDFGDVETTYAHYTMTDMTKAELSLVDRDRILGLVASTLPREFSLDNLPALREKYAQLFRRYQTTEDMDIDQFNDETVRLLREAFPMQYDISSWSVTGNLLTMEVNGNTLRTLNTLVRTIEKDEIVDNCTIITARKDRKQDLDGQVDARVVVYLQQPAE